MNMFVWMIVFWRWKCVEGSGVCKGTKASCIPGWATDEMQAGGLGSGNWSSLSSLCGHTNPARCNSVNWRIQGYSLPSTGTLFQFKSPSKDQEEIISIVTTSFFWRPDIQEDWCYKTCQIYNLVTVWYHFWKSSYENIVLSLNMCFSWNISLWRKYPDYSWMLTCWRMAEEKLCEPIGLFQFMFQSYWNWMKTQRY